MASTLRIAAVADIHCGHENRDFVKSLFSRAAKEADVLLLCGDLTHRGTVEEAHILAEQLSALANIPVMAVLGNHDFENGAEKQVESSLLNAGVAVLDGDVREVRGVGFVGLKGFAGGFGRFQLEAWGESTIKDFVQEAVDEALKLESALARLENEKRVVFMHYSPVACTIEGEPREIFPFMGSSRLEQPIDWFGAAAVFHGHAHGGTAEGTTAHDIPVYNVSLHVLQKAFPDRPPFRIIEMP
ncbi:MAG: metallophosphoesterase, partial [Chitinivibrionales bacterium]|nr:metallophosphoesterase [Chitinivibrionales bacterium]MBD3355729.1 metallophosphoesterase [Chitinivibrionales bacterium]